MLLKGLSKIIKKTVKNCQKRQKTVKKIDNKHKMLVKATLPPKLLKSTEKTLYKLLHWEKHK